MRNILWIYAVLAAGIFWSPIALGNEDSVQNELDGFWAEVSRTVAEGDFEAYKATYHADAVLVSESSKTSYPISQALERWEQGFIDTKEGKNKSNVEFRFNQRLHDADTAHETGIFHYSFQSGDGEPQGEFIHFEALMVKKDGWKMMMEYQKHPATATEWEEAR